MKKFIFLSGCLAALIALASCEKKVVETDFPQDEMLMVPVTLTGSIPETRVSLDGVTPKWTAGDRLAILTADGALCPAFTADQGGSATTTFSGTKPDGSTLSFALFPYSSYVSQSGGNYTLSLPATQDGTLGNAVMAAKVPAGEGEMVFSNLLTVVRVSIPSGMRITRIELQRSDRVSGSFTVNGSTLAVTPAASPTDADKRVVVEKSAGFSGEDVLISVLPSSSKHLDLLLTNAEGKMALVSKTLKTDFSAGHLKTATVPSNLVFSDVAKIGASTAAQQYIEATQIDRQQVTNGDFESWTVSHTYSGTTYYTPNHFNSFKQAEGLLSGLAYSSSSPQVNQATGSNKHSGEFACDIWSRKVSGVVAQGNLTTGCINAGSMSASGSGNYNFTKTSDPSKSMAFTAQPIAISFWAKYVPAGSSSNVNTYVARVAAYLHDNNNFRTLANGGVSNGTQIALAEKEIPEKEKGTWNHYTVDFKYSSSANVNDISFVLINIMTNKTPGGGATGDHLYIDDIEMIYPDTYNIKTGSTGWATMYVDFNALVPSGATAYYITKITGGYAELVAIPSGSVIPNNTGVLIKGSANTQYTFDGSKNTPVTVSGNLLQGTLTSISKPSGTCRVLSSESSSSMAAFGAFTGSTIAANTAWLTE